MTSSALTSWYQVAGIVGGFSTAVAVAVAITAGLVAFHQYRLQKVSALQITYMTVYREYTQASEEFFTQFSVVPGVYDALACAAFQRSAARLVHYIGSIYRISCEAGNLFSDVDYVLLIHDLDRLKTLIPAWLDALHPSVIDAEIQRLGFSKIRNDLGESITERQSAVLSGLEAKMRAALETKEGSPRTREIWAEVERDIETTFAYKPPQEFSLNDPFGLFNKGREMQSFLLLRNAVEEVASEIHQTSLDLTVGSID